LDKNGNQINDLSEGSFMIDKTNFKNNFNSDNEKIEIWNGEKNAMDGLVSVMSRVISKADVVADSDAPSFSMNIKEIKKEYINFKKRGVYVRFITDITKENIPYCKELMEYVELRHLDQVKGNMAISESEYVATADLKGAKPLTQTIYSNAKAILEQHKYFFENLWSKSIPSEQKFHEIENGIEREVFDIMHDYNKIVELINNLIESCNQEIQILLPNEESLVLFNDIGIIDKILILSEKNNIVIKMIFPNEYNKYIDQKLRQFKNIHILNGGTSDHGLLIVDDKAFLRIEFGISSKNNSFNLFELAIYSNNKKSVDLFKSMFNLLWNERKVVVDLEIADKLQKNFINVAAHELRTPIQTIIGLTSLLKSKKEIIIGKEDEIIDVISRNADRLQKLAENILYKTKIESQGLTLTKEKFNMIEKIKHVVEDIQSQDINRDIKVVMDLPKDIVIVNADKIRIYELLSNLLNNAIQFTKKGNIYISLFESSYSANQCRSVVVKITDTGTGINSDLLPKLFTQFITDSSFGTGLGLHICKNIVDAHGGKIWAENNKDGKGATFYFSLPCDD